MYEPFGDTWKAEMMQVSKQKLAEKCISAIEQESSEPVKEPVRWLFKEYLQLAKKDTIINFLRDLRVSEAPPIEREAILKVLFSDTTKSYKKTVQWIEGNIYSGYDNEIISKDGGWFIPEGIREKSGYILFDKDGRVLEAVTEGYVSMRLYIKV